MKLKSSFDRAGMPYIAVRHNIEVAHRMFEMQGKCQQIHGHSMIVEMRIFGEINMKGVLAGLEFGRVKSIFRSHLDDRYDHQLLLNESDPWAQLLAFSLRVSYPGGERRQKLPGLRTVPGDPTTENLAKWIAEWGLQVFSQPVEVIVYETATNSASYTAEDFDVGL